MATAALPTLSGIARNGDGLSEFHGLQEHNQAMRRLVTAVQDLSLARNLESIMAVVRTAARQLTGADGATFVLRDGDRCHYADEDAISPLWKGQKFPMSACISGWTMLNGKSAVIEDIYADARIPADAYRPTFVQSLVMVPIRTQAPLGAIGTYWARRHAASPQEIEVLQALANTTAVAMENVSLYTQLEQRVRDRTVQLEASNKELEFFSYSVSHDLKGPLRRINQFSQLLTDECKGGQLGDEAVRHLGVICSEAGRMTHLIDDLLKLASLTQTTLHFEPVNLSATAGEIAEKLRSSAPERKTEFRIQPNAVVAGHPLLLRVVLDNLLSNSWKFTSKVDGTAVIQFGFEQGAYFVRDNGAGFNQAHAGKLFLPFQRMHSQSDFPGTGIGLATVHRIVQRHGGRVWAEATEGKGASFYFTLPDREI